MQTSVEVLPYEIEEAPRRVMPRSTGRPTKFTREVLDKLQDAYLAQATDEQACLLAGITQSALYKYQQRHPEFLTAKKAWQSMLAMQAKKSLQKHIPRDGKLALDVIERLEKDKWSLRTELTGNEGAPLTFSWIAPKE